MLREYPFQPGVIKDDTAYASKGYSIDSDKIRWVRGKAESQGGWQTDTDALLEGACRAGHPWSANDGARYVAFGTHLKLYAYLSGRVYDITPVDAQITLAADPIETTAGSSIVTITDVAHGRAVDNTVYITGATAVGGVQVGGVSGAYAADPFQVTAGSPMVLVNQPAHGLATGDFVDITGGTAVGGITVSGLYSISVYSVDFYTIQDDTPATSSATGGGTPSYATRKGYRILTIVDADHYTIDVGTPAAADATGGGAVVKLNYELAGGNAHGVGSGGYGLGGYGEGPYGIFLGGSTDSEPRIWCLGNYGEFLTANPIGGHLYQWQLNVSVRASQIPNSPDRVLWHVVTAERVIFAMGCTSTSNVFDPMLQRNCDIQDNTVWLPADNNNAGDERLSEGSRIIAGCNTQGGILVWTDTGLYYTRYTGSTDGLYASDLVGTECGLMGPNSFVEQEGSAYWVSRAAAFYQWKGGAPSFVPSPMREWFSRRLTPNQQYEVFAFYDSANPAVTWLFPSTPSIECNEYMRVDLPMAQADPNAGWSNGTFDRTMWFDLGIFENPIAVDSGGAIYRQNIGNTANGAAIERYVTMSLLEGDNSGDATILLSRVAFDCDIRSGVLQLVFRSRKWPNGPETVKGPYNVQPSTLYNDVRVKGRQIEVGLQSVGTDDDWRVGQPRYDVSGSTLR